MNSVPSINKTKTTEAIALILKLHQKPMILDRLLKIMYFIDSLCLAQNNQSLTNDSYKITKKGLKPYQIGGLIDELQQSESLTIPQTGYIALTKKPTLDSLTDLEIRITTHIYLQKRGINPFNFIDWNYDLDFLKSHTKSYSDALITPVHIMMQLGKSKAEISTYLNSQKLTFTAMTKPGETPKVAVPTM